MLLGNGNDNEFETKKNKVAPRVKLNHNMYIKEFIFPPLQYSSSYAPGYGRLNHHSTYIAKRNDKGQWIQVDFGKVAKVTKMGTQGRYNVGQWITKYIVSYSIDGGFFEYQLHKPYNVPRVSITNEG